MKTKSKSRPNENPKNASRLNMWRKIERKRKYKQFCFSAKKIKIKYISFAGRVGVIIHKKHKRRDLLFLTEIWAFPYFNANTNVNYLV